MAGGLIAGSAEQVAPIDSGELNPVEKDGGRLQYSQPQASPRTQYYQSAPAQYVPSQYVQQQYAPAQYTQQQYTQQQYAPEAAPKPAMSKARKGAIGFSLMSGLFPFPFNPLFIPFQMTIFIIMIIVLLSKGYSFWTAALLSWLIPGLIAAVIHYMFLSGLLSIVGMGEAPPGVPM
jgi:hypothetical protein